MKIPEELEQYRPLTTLETLDLIWCQIKPFIMVALMTIMTSGFYAYVVTGNESVYTLVGLSVPILIALGLTIIALKKRPNLHEAVKGYLIRKDGYSVAYHINMERFNEIRPMSREAQNIFHEHFTDAEGIYFVLPLRDDQDGMVFFGKKDWRKEAYQPVLVWWNVRAKALSYYYSDRTEIRLIFIDKERKCTQELSLRQAIDFVTNVILKLNTENNTIRAANELMLKKSAQGASTSAA